MRLKMFLSEFVDSCYERYLDPVGIDGVSNSPYLARTAACSIVELIHRGFDVFDFVELIYYENAQYESRSGYQMAMNESELPF